MTITKDFIAHFGVRGMKWGITNKSSSGGKKSKKGKTKVSDLSDDDLKKKINRLNMEKQYKSLLQDKKDQSVVRRGAKVTAQIIGKSAKKSITTVTTKEFTQALQKAVDKKAKRAVAVATAG